MLHDTVRRLQERGVVCRAYPTDVSVAENADAVIGDVVAEHGKIDVTVCAAGGGVPTAPFPTGGTSEFLAGFQRNVVTAFTCARRQLGR